MTTSSRSFENDLIEHLSLEMYLDGGSTIVTAFGDFYDDDKKIARLLKRCQSRKLLSFLESKPDFFHVSDRSKPPHIVSLRQLGIECAERVLQERQRVGNEGGENMTSLMEAAATALEERVAYLLRQRISKVVRRARAQRQPIGSIDVGVSANASTCTCSATTSVGPGPVPIKWVTRKCSNDLHRYARLLPSRPVGVLPKSDEWIDASVPTFVTFFLERSSSLFIVTMEEKDGDNPLPLVDLCPEEKEKVIDSLSIDSKSGSIDSVDVEAVSARVFDVLKNLAPVGGVQLGRLLSDLKLRSLLGGIDLLILIQANPSLFDSVSLFRDETQTHSQWFIMLNWNRKGGVGNTKENDDDENCQIGFGDLAADEVGLFSLTNPTIAMAMAKVLRNTLIANVNTSKQPQFETAEPTLVKDNALSETALAIDLTAGIGGNTIALAKVFPTVIAFEIDENRSKLLGENIQKKLGVVSSRVTLKCEDSMNALGGISSKYRAVGEEKSPICVIVDPPWGGMNYRRKCCDDELRLGKDMPLYKVVSLVRLHLAPVVLGMKLPLQFPVKPFLERLHNLPYFCSEEERRASEDDSPLIRVVTIKKLGKQLFLVLDLR